MFKGYRTLLINVASAIVGVLIAADYTDLGVSTATAGLIVTGLGAVNTVLRFFTDTPVGKSS